jgi:hypothetical protein
MLPAIENAIFITVVLLRFFVPLLIPKFPLPAILACLVLDAADQTIFQLFTDKPLTGYQTYDKALDIYYLAIAYISAMRTWRDPVAFGVARFLYLYRLVGVTAFELLDQRWLLLVFPNTFEYFFIAYEAIRTRWNPARLSARFVVTMAAFIWIFIKLPQEWWIHIAKLDFTEFMADHSYMWGVLFGLVAGAGIVIYTQRAKIPAADWPFTVDVDRHLPAFDTVATGHEKFFSAVLVEKAIFLALVSVIFAQVLPDVRSSNLGVAIGVILLVVINSAISQALRRRGRSWSSTGAEFGAMFLINTAIVTVDALLDNQEGGATPALNTLFFVLILSLLIALYDRFRSTRDTTVETPGVVASFRAEQAARAAATTTIPTPT